MKHKFITIGEIMLRLTPPDYEKIGVAGERKSMEEIDQILAERRKNWKPVEPKYKKGVLRLFSQHAASPMKGAYLEY